MEIRNKVIGTGLIVTLALSPVISKYINVGNTQASAQDNPKKLGRIEQIIDSIEYTGNNILDGLIAFAEDPIDVKVRNTPLERVVIGYPYTTISGFFGREEGTWPLDIYYDRIRNAPENQRLMSSRTDKNGMFNFSHLRMGDTLYVPNCDGK